MDRAPSFCAGDRGFTLIEVVIAIVVLSAAALGVVSAYATSELAARMVEEEAAVDNALRAHVAEIRADAQDDLNAVITSLTGSGTGGLFDVHSVRTGALKPIEGSTSVGHIYLYLNEPTVPAEFGGNGAGLDLNRDGVVSGVNLLATPSAVMLLPVEVRAEWRSPAGDAIKRRFLLVARRRDGST